ncbi:oligomeric Golgi complex subunit 7 [Polychytrium aggregatum]|uniref:oligomeric Golgi complex subunit 7 n=1 Tax=Polychytrium aggregatum TaxID=110093 RepID=UPI0022FEF980|nr:oligomeric Golgi complex subunit 7 [Polychytrium aggregatum]KAI9202735.1 oligomeric Golgi complex subunit 7 [Polychytrium aggregatum]
MPLPIDPASVAGDDASPEQLLPSLLKKQPYASRPAIDLADFGHPSFDPKSWINLALNATGPDAASSTAAAAPALAKSDPILTQSDSQLSLGSSDSSSRVVAGPGLSTEQHVAQLLTQLHLSSQDAAYKLHQLAKDMVGSISQSYHDIEYIRQDSRALKALIQTAKLELESTQTQTGSAIDHLGRLDVVRGRMEQTRDALKEAENWNSLSIEIEGLFDSGDYHKAALRLKEAQKSLGLLANTADYSARLELLTKLQNQLEITSSTQLVSALAEHDTDTVKRLFEIFENIQKSDQFFYYYFLSKKTPLMRSWTSVASASPAVSPGPSSLYDVDTQRAGALGQFFEQILILLNKEYTWSALVFPNAKQIMNGLLYEIFATVDPSLANVLTKRAAADDGLLFIVEAYQSASKLGCQIEKLLSMIQIDFKSAYALSTHLGSSESLTSDRWQTALFEPFLSFQTHYGDQEKKLLVRQLLEVLQTDARTDFMETTQMMTDTTGQIFTIAEGAFARCRTLTSGFGALDLIASLRYYFVKVVDQYRAIVQQTRYDIGIESKAGAKTGTGAHSSAAGTATASSDALEFANSDLATQEWSNFQVGLRVLGVCCSFSKRMKVFEGQFCTWLAHMKRRVEFIHEEPGDPAKADALDLEEDSCQGARSSLRLSTLNSFALSSLYEQVGERTVAEGIPGFSAEVRSTLAGFTGYAQRFVFDTMFSMIEKHLMDVPVMPLWGAALPTTTGPFNLQVPQFSFSPQPYITRIGEYLVTLPHQLELYLEDEALAFSIRGLPYLKEEDFQAEAPASEPGAESSGADPSDDSLEATHLWITSVCRGSMVQYVNVIMGIRCLSEDGRKQLLADIGYISNVYDAMDIELVVSLRRLCGLLQATVDEYQSQFAAKLAGQAAEENDTFGDLDMVRRVAGIRGIALDG